MLRTSFQCFRKIQRPETDLSRPDRMIDRFCAYDELCREPFAFTCITDTGIDRPSFLQHLLNKPVYKRITVQGDGFSMAAAAVDLIAALSTFRRIFRETASGSGSLTGSAF